MANIKISELTALTPPAAADLVPVTDSSASQTKRTTVGEIVGIINGDVDVADDGAATISELPVSKLQDGAARQLLQTDAAGTGVEWTSNVDIPGTLDATGATTLDSTLDVAGLASLDGGIDVDGAFTVANTSGNIATSGTLGVTGQSTLASAAVSDLTSGRVVLAGTSGELEDSAGLTFNGTQLDVDGDVIITGDLTVEGTTTTIESQTLTVKDKNIELGVVASPTDVTADGGGITLKGATDKTINWIDSTDAWTLSEHVSIASAKEYRINGTKVLDATSLGSAVVSSSLTSVGTIGTGVWNGTAIATAYIADSAVTSAKIADDAIVNADVNASAAIAGTKIDPDFGSQAVTTTGLISADGKVSFPLGTAALPSLYPGSDTNTGIYSPGADQLAISTNGSERARVDSSGRLLVGTSTAPSTVGPLQIVDTVSPALVLARNDTSIGGGNSIGEIRFFSNDSTAASYEQCATIAASADGDFADGDKPTRLVFSTTADGASSPTERMRIDSYGSVLINTGSNPFGFAGTIIAPDIYSTHTTAAGANLHIATQGIFYRSTSSIKYKTDVETMQDSYADAILNSRPVWYRSTCTADNSEWGYWGFIAEEIAEIDPRLVHWKTHEAEKDEEDNDIQVELDQPIAEGVQYERFVPHLLNLIKRQKDQIEAMEARLSALEAS